MVPLVPAHPSGRPVRAFGALNVCDGVAFTYVDVGADGGAYWRCARCLKLVQVRRNLAVSRKQAVAFRAHLDSCLEEGRHQACSVPLVPTDGHARSVFVVRDVGTPSECLAALKNVSVLKKWTGVVLGDHTDAPDTREQGTVTLGSSERGGLRGLASRVLDLLNGAHSGWFVRSDTLFVLRHGSLMQRRHLDHMKDSSGVHHSDSLTAFVCLAEERPLGVLTSSGVETLVMRMGDVLVLGAGVYHCGLSQTGSNECLFFYLDRYGSGSLSDSKESVGVFWEQLSLPSRRKYVVSVDYCDRAGFAASFRIRYHLAVVAPEAAQTRGAKKRAISELEGGD